MMPEPTTQSSSSKTNFLVIGLGVLFTAGAISYAIYAYANKKDGRRGRTWRQSTRQLYDAAKKNDLETIQALIDQGTKPNDNLRRYSSRAQAIRPVEIAAYNGHVDAVKLLESSGIDLPKSRALFFAVQSNNIKLVQYLLESGCDPNQKVLDNEEKPIHVVVRAYGKRELPFSYQRAVIELLLKYKVKLDAKGIEGQTAVQLALMTKQYELASYLLGHYEPFSEKNAFGFEELLLAAKPRNQALIDELLDKNAKLTVKHAILLEDKELIAEKLSENETQKRDPTVVQFATKHRLHDLAIYLIDLGVTTKFKNPQRNSAIHYAVLAKSENFLKELIARNADVDSLNVRQLSPLHLAIEVKFEKGIDILASSGCDLDIRSGMFGSPLEYAISSVKYGLAKKLIRLGADPNSAKSFPLHKYCSQATTETDELINLLIEKTTDINRVDRQGKTALHYALGGYINRNTIQKLLEKGADISIEDDSKMSPYQLARLSEDVELIELILKYAEDSQ